MSSQRYPPEFKDEAVRQVLERGYTVAEVSQRLGVSAHSLYKWVKAVKPDKSDELAAELVAAKSKILSENGNKWSLVLSTLRDLMQSHALAFDKRDYEENADA